MELFKKAYFLSVSPSVGVRRWISTSGSRLGKRNFRKFQFPNKRGSGADKEYLRKHLELCDHRGQRPYFISKNEERVVIPEMIPELIVPDLTDFTLKPYVSYRAPDVVQEKFTAQDLFYCVYADKIRKDFNEGKLDEDGNSVEPSAEEKMTAEEAKIKAQQTGSDLFG